MESGEHDEPNSNQTESGHVVEHDLTLEQLSPADCEGSIERLNPTLPEPEARMPSGVAAGVAVLPDSKVEPNAERDHTQASAGLNGTTEWFTEAVPGFVPPREPVCMKADGASGSLGPLQSESGAEALGQAQLPKSPCVWHRHGSAVPSDVSSPDLNNEILPENHSEVKPSSPPPSKAWTPNRAVSEPPQSSDPSHRSTINDWHDTIQTRRALKEISGINTAEAEDAKASDASTVVIDTPLERARRRNQSQRGSILGRTKSASKSLDSENISSQLREHFKSQSMAPSAPLQRKFEEFKKLVARGEDASGYAVFHSPYPVAVLLQWWIFQILLLLIAAVYATSAAVAVSRASSAGGICHFPLYRITALDDGAPVLDFGLQLGGCPLSVAGEVVATSDVETRLVLNASAEMDGFWLHVPDGEAGPRRFRVEGSADSATWTTCGAAVWKFGAWGAVQLLDVAQWQAWEGGEEALTVDVRPGLSWYLDSVVHSWVLAAFFTAATVCGFVKRARAGVWMLVVGYGTAALVSFAGAVAAFVQGERGSFTPLAYAIMEGVAALVLAKAERLVVELIGAMGAVLLGARVIADITIWEVPQDLVGSRAPFSAVLLLVLGFISWLLRARLNAKAFESIRDDKRRYEDAFQAIYDSEDYKTQQPRLDEEIKQFTETIKLGPVQLNRTAEAEQRPQRRKSMFGGAAPSPRPRRSFFDGTSSSSAAASAAASSEEKRLDPKAPVTSLDQLYSQARFVQLLLQLKVERWALRCKGMFPIKKEGESAEGTEKSNGDDKPEFVRYKAVLNQPNPPEIEWPAVKNPERAVDKIVQSYGGDVSKLVDLCRHRIVFESVADLRECLGLILGDTELRVRAIKNRMSFAWDIRRSAGFRDISINFHIESTQTRELLCDTHVCELQLQLRPMAELQNHKTHERYLKFRKETSNKALWRELKKLLPTSLQSKRDDSGEVHAFARKLSVRVLKRNPTQKLVHATKNWVMSSFTPARSSAGVNRVQSTQERRRPAPRQRPRYLEDNSPPPMKAIPSNRSNRVEPVTDMPENVIGHNGHADSQSDAGSQCSNSENGERHDVDSDIASTVTPMGTTATIAIQPVDRNGGASPVTLEPRKPAVSPVLSVSAASPAPSPLNVAMKSVRKEMSEGMLSPKPAAVRQGSASSDMSCLDGEEDAGRAKRAPYRKAKGSMTMKTTGDDGGERLLRVQSAGTERDDELPLSSQIENVVARAFKQSATEPHGEHSNAAKRWHTAMAAASAWSAFHTSTPLVTAITIAANQAIFALAGGIFLIVLIVSCVELDMAYREACSYSSYRFIVESIGPGWMLDGGLLADGCVNHAVSMSAGALKWSGTHYVASLAEAAEMNGFWFESREAHGRIPVADFRVDGSDDAQTWHTCSASDWVTAPFPIDVGAAERVLVDLRPHWSWVLVRSVHALRGLGYVGIAACGKVHFEVQAQTLFILMQILVGLVYAAASCGCFLQRPSVTCIIWAGAAVASLAVGWSVTLVHRHLLSVLLVYTCLLMLVHVMERPVTGNMSLPGAMFADGLLVVLGTTLMCVRAKKLHDTASKIQADREKYDEIWRLAEEQDQGQRRQEEEHDLEEEMRDRTEEVRDAKVDEDEQDEAWRRRAELRAERARLREERRAVREDGTKIERLRKTIASLKVAPHFTRQYNRAVPRVARGFRRWKSIENLFVPSLAKKSAGMDQPDIDKVNLESPVTDLDQLFKQADGVYPLLRAKTKAWAEASGGLLLRQEGTTKRYAPVSDPAPIKWAKLKRPVRAIEKVLRSYGGDASKLCDICRQSIIFDDIAGMKKCVEAIKNDNLVAIVRVKNRLDPNYDSSLSLGYRDVAMNLRILSPEAWAIGVETHVCELQLILHEFAINKSDQGHKRYVEFRNARAE